MTYTQYDSLQSPKWRIMWCSRICMRPTLLTWEVRRKTPGPGAKIKLSNFWRRRPHSSPVSIGPLCCSPYRISCVLRLKHGIEVGMISRYGTPRGCEQRTEMGNLGGCMEDVGYQVRRCEYHRHQRQSVEPLHMLQQNFDEEKWQVLCPWAKSDYDIAK